MKRAVVLLLLLFGELILMRVFGLTAHPRMGNLALFVACLLVNGCIVSVAAYYRIRFEDWRIRAHRP